MLNFWCFFQLRAALYDIHDVFFVLTSNERMQILSQDREIRKEKQLRQMVTFSVSQWNIHLSTLFFCMLKYYLKHFKHIISMVSICPVKQIKTRDGKARKMLKLPEQVLIKIFNDLMSICKGNLVGMRENKLLFQME